MPRLAWAKISPMSMQDLKAVSNMPAVKCCRTIWSWRQGWRWCREPWRELPELIIQDAIDKHFDTEQANFLRSNEPENNAPRIKTLSLFFIDSIKSYRDDEGWLKVTFERLLKRN